MEDKELEGKLDKINEKGFRIAPVVCEERILDYLTSGIIFGGMGFGGGASVGYFAGGNDFVQVGGLVGGVVGFLGGVFYEYFFER